MTVRTRFAPSPTGFMHIGGMRTALFNWLWARHNGGSFILRIDDTDQKRNMEEALAPILDAFRWLNLEWDEGPEVGGAHGPYYQSQRGELYEQALQRLLESDSAYHDFEDPAETQARRDSASKAKTVFLSSRSSLEIPRDERMRRAAAGERHVIRLLVPRDQTVAVTDHVRGRVSWECGLMPDPVIARADGSPLYNFATVVDDAAMQITHVIRAEEHLSNTPVQLLIFNALGLTAPEYAHIPFVSAPGSNRKLSKRDVNKYRNSQSFRRFFELSQNVLPAMGLDPESDALSPVMVEYYRQIGFLPAGVLNGLGRLGWSLDESSEYFSREQLISAFTLDRVVNSSAGLDADKLLSYQQHWMQTLSPEARLAGVRPFLAAAYPGTRALDDQFVTDVLELGAERLRVFGDVLTFDEFFCSTDQLPRDEKAYRKRILKDAEAVGRIRALAEKLQQLPEWSVSGIEGCVVDFMAQQEIGAGKIMPALRLVATGKPQGLDLYPSLALLGKEEVMARIAASLEYVGNLGEAG